MAKLSQVRVVRLLLKEATNATKLCQRAQHRAKAATA
jgi:hypothetical protein